MTEQQIRELICELCRNFYGLGWVTGTGGSISIKVGENAFAMTPSGVQKERIKPEELFIVDENGTPIKTPTTGSCKLSDCAPLFLHAYNQRGAGAVIHTHGTTTNLVTMLFDGESEFRITKQEMIKGIDGHGYFDELVIPIIENTAWEHELADSLGEAIAKYPKSPAVLVRQHGMYVWGKTWEQAKRHAECLHYLFDMALESKKLGFTHLISKKRESSSDDDSAAKRACVESFKYKHVVLDIEGTLAPITFVKDVLFPYAAKHVETFLTANWTEPSVVNAIKDLAAQLAADVAAGVFQGDDVPKDLDSIANATAFFRQCVAADRKLTPLKLLQGQIWEAGYKSGALVSQIYADVVPNLKRIVDSGAKVSIYSSGSRQAQHLLFQYSDNGDVRNLLSCYFDTTIGLKQEAESYRQILLTLGANPSEVLFVTDVLGEAKAAAAAGLSAMITSRPGNATITEEHSFPVIDSFAAIV